MKSLNLIADGSLEGETPQGLSIIQIVERIVVYAVETIQPNIHSCPTEFLSVFFAFLILMLRVQHGVATWG